MSIWFPPLYFLSQSERAHQQRAQVDEIWRTLQDLDVVDQVACGARIDAAAELGDLEKALELVSFMKKERAMARFRRFMDIVSV